MGTWMRVHGRMKVGGAWLQMHSHESISTGAHVMRIVYA